MLEKLRLNKTKIMAIFTMVLLLTLTFGGIITTFAQSQEQNNERVTLFQPSASQDSLCGIQSDANSTLLQTSGSCADRFFTGACANLINTGTTVLTGTEFRELHCSKGEAKQELIDQTQQPGQGGLLGGLSFATGTILQQKPMSTQKFVEERIYAISNFGKVNAQTAPTLYYPGTGFDLLNPIRGLWGWSVNVVYGLLILIIVGVALAIIFRSSLDGATAITIQNAIPNIAMAMILVPLSYAISGLFIDGVTVGTNVVHQFLLGNGSPAQVVYQDRSKIGVNLSGFETIPDTTSTSTNSRDRGLFPDDERVNIFNAKNGIAIDDDFNAFANADPNFRSINQFGLVLGITQIFDPTATGWIGEIVNLALAVLLFITSFRIFILLVGKYVMMLTVPIFSPFIFATVAVPGNGTKTIMQYVKMMGSFSLYYIVTYAMLLVGIVLSNASFQASIPDFAVSGYVPPLLGFDNTIRTLIDDGSFSFTGFLLGLVAVGIYLNIPSTLKSIDAALGVQFSLPSFVTNAVQSARDSVDLARRAGTAAGQVRQAPALAARTRTNVLQGTRNLSDRLRGRRPGEQNTSLYRRRQDAFYRIQELERQRQNAIQAGNDVQAALLANQIRQTQSTLTNLGGAAGLDQEFKDFKAGEMKVDVTWNGKGGPIILDEQVVKQLIIDYRRGTRVTVLAKGTLAIKTSNIKFTPAMISRLQLFSAENGGVILRSDVVGAPTGEPNPNRAGEFAIRDGATPIHPGPFSVGSTFNDYVQFLVPPRPPLRNLLEILWEGNEAHPTGDGTSWQVDFKIRVNDIGSLLGIGGVDALISPNKLTATAKFIFRLKDVDNRDTGDVESNVFDIKLLTNYAVEQSQFDV